MTDTDLISAVDQRSLRRAASDLHRHYVTVFSEEAIAELLEDSYLSLAVNATVTRWLVLNTERFTRQRLDALVHAEAAVPGRAPAVLFLCAHNTDRSQMALGFLHHRSRGRAVAWSGGSEPTAEISPSAVAAMAEVGIDISAEFPKPCAAEFFTAADVVVTMGCGDVCPLVPGKRYEDWPLDDPSGKTLEEVRAIRDQIGRRVDHLLDRLASRASSPQVSTSIGGPYAAYGIDGDRGAPGPSHRG